MSRQKNSILINEQALNREPVPLRLLNQRHKSPKASPMETPLQKGYQAYLPGVLQI